MDKKEFRKKKVLVHQDNTPYHKSVKRRSWKASSHPPYSSDPAPSDISCSQISKKCSLGRHFRRMDESYYKHGIEKLEGRYNQVPPLRGIMLNTKNYFTQKKCVLLWWAVDYSLDLLFHPLNFICVRNKNGKEILQDKYGHTIRFA
ncbi:hypothetical protein GWI33_018924 [Rhynchophorus ferrugineus]|uniref:Uncharacterized protein n=1 Tax=Rhynchophorus ferrugineus TaxID=354439 RepID=A0A834M4N8_RHYFE|nr:hypothetical protein GWI33_018924 [Rhynchophorus ferrugineus]